MTNQHGCSFDWCENESDSCEAQRLEHSQAAVYVPATGRSLDGYDNIPMIGVALSFNEDLEAAPTVTLAVQRGLVDVAELELRIDEAVILYNTLGKAIVKACKGTRLSPKRIASFYREGPK